MLNPRTFGAILSMPESPLLLFGSAVESHARLTLLPSIISELLNHAVLNAAGEASTHRKVVSFLIRWLLPNSSTVFLGVPVPAACDPIVRMLLDHCIVALS